MTNLQVPRRIDKTIGRVAKSRAHARGASKSRRRRRAIRELKRLRQVLEQLQMRTIDGTLPHPETLEEMLSSVEHHMKTFTSTKPKRRRLRKLAKGLKRARKRFAEL